MLNAPYRWTCKTASHSSSVMLNIILSLKIPAGWHKISTPPKFSTAVFTILDALSKSATESNDAIAFPPSALISLTTRSAGASDSPVPSTATPKSFTTTLAPSLESHKATSLPIPLPAPVTIATLFNNLSVI